MKRKNDVDVTFQEMVALWLAGERFVPAFSKRRGLIYQ
jgi:hypothetical protein